MASPNSPRFKKEFTPHYGQAVEILPQLQRITCNNPSPFTFHGTNTYILGHERLAIIDPGPMNDAHLEALIKTIAGRPVSHIIVTHTHMDHAPLARPLAQRTKACIWAQGSHRPARPLNIGENNPMDASADHDFQPDYILKHGDEIEGDGFTLTALFTPGHTANHMAFGWKNTDYLFSGDHVMAWATSIVAPPDGAMSDYMHSLEILLQQPQQTYFPGHGGRVEKAHSFVRALRTHRIMREQAILTQLKQGCTSIPEIVAIIYKTTDKKLHGAAALSVFAHIEDLVARNQVHCDGPLSIESHYTVRKMS